jgi:3'(2'), 5'-bisphosphate nucleotidase
MVSERIMHPNDLMYHGWACEWAELSCPGKRRIFGMNNQYERQKMVGIEAVKKAASLCYRVQRDFIGGERGLLNKSDHSPVTTADYGSQAIICRILKEAFPEDSIVAEENSSLIRLPENEALLNSTASYVEQVLGDRAGGQQICEWVDWGDGSPADCFWTLDPIDGTKGFLRGDQYAVALALVVDYKVKLGLLACPNLPYSSPDFRFPENFSSGSLYVGIAGGGSLLMSLDGKESQAIHVSDISDPDKARFVESYESKHSNFQIHQAIIHSLNNEFPPARMDSQAKYGLLARGAVDAYMRIPSAHTPDYREKIWDHAAGSLIVQEAGGIVTDIHGQPLDFSLGRQLTANQGIVASQGSIHHSVIEAIQKLGST